MALESLNGILSMSLYGSTMFQYLEFALTILVSAILGQFFGYVFVKYGGKIASKTHNAFDDLLINAAAKPLAFFFVISGIYLGSTFLTPESPAALQTIYTVIGMLVIFNLAYFLIKLVDGIITIFLKPLVEKTESRIDDQIIPVLSKLSKLAIALVAFILVLDNFGFDVITLLAGLGIVGVAIAFAAQETISDVFGGLSIFASRPFVVGDTVEIDGVPAVVEQVGMRYTRMRDFDGRVNVYPNRKIATGVLKNWTSEPSRRVKLDIGLTYDTSVEQMEKAIQIIRKIIGEHPLTTEDIRVGFNDFKDYSLNILVVYFVKSSQITEILAVQNEINLAIKKSFEKEKIEFAFPTHTVYMRK